MSQAIIDILNVFKKYNKNEAIAKRSGNPLWWVEFRCEYDPDAKYYYEVEKLDPWDAIRGDVITSFWTPYNTLLKRETGLSVSKKVNKELDLLIIQINSTRPSPLSEKIKAVNKRFERFAELYYTKGNFMLLPIRPKGMRESLNQDRMKFTDDRIDWTLFECFKSGKLSKFFQQNDNAVKQWIQEENLTSLFVNQEIDKDHIDWFIPGDKPKKFSMMSTSEIVQYLDRAVALIEHRNQS